MNFFPHTPPDDTVTRGQIEYLKDEGNKAPAPKPGDRYILSGAIAGIIIGFLIGVFSGFLLAGFFAGGIVGMLIGSFVGVCVRKYRQFRNNQKTN